MQERNSSKESLNDLHTNKSASKMETAMSIINNPEPAANQNVLKKESYVSNASKLKERGKALKSIINNYYNSIEELELQMKSKREEIRMKQYDNPSFDDGSDRRARIQAKLDEMDHL